MDDEEIRAKLGPGGSYGDLPGRHITINQIVAWNLAYWRKVAGLTQEELGEKIGWSNVVVSSAERSWEGKRPRHFSADDLCAIAAALRLPVAALLLPPADDGNDVRYMIHLNPPDGECNSMYDLMVYVLSEPTEEEGQVADSYRKRYVSAVGFYLGAAREEVTKYVEDLTTEERVVEHLAALRRQYDALREVLSDNDRQQDALGVRLSELRHARRTPSPAAPGQVGGDQ